MADGSNEGLVALVSAVGAATTTWLTTYLRVIRGLSVDLDVLTRRIKVLEDKPSPQLTIPDLSDLRDRVASLEADMRELEPLLRDAVTRPELQEMAALFGDKFERIMEGIGYVKGRIKGSLGG